MNNIFKKRNRNILMNNSKPKPKPRLKQNLNIKPNQKLKNKPLLKQQQSPQKPNPFPLKESYNSIIPLNVYQTWHSKTLPHNMNKFRNRLIRENPEFTFHLFDDEDCENFIKEHFHPIVFWTFQQLIPGAYKADLWRYCILYKFGGIYLDIKYYTINGFKLIAFTEHNHFCNDFNVTRDNGIITQKSGVYNALMVSVPENPIFLNCIHRIIYHVRNRFYGKNPLSPTGPQLLKHFFNIQQRTNWKLFFLRGRNAIRYGPHFILEYYPNYRNEQIHNQKTKHYHVLWHNKNIYVKINKNLQLPPMIGLNNIIKRDIPLNSSLTQTILNKEEVEEVEEVEKVELENEESIN